MNGSSSAEAYTIVPSLMSFIGLETSTSQRHQQQQLQLSSWSDLDAAAAASQPISLHHHFYTQGGHLGPAGAGGVTAAVPAGSGHSLFLGDGAGGGSSSAAGPNPYFDSSTQVAASATLLSPANFPAAAFYGGSAAPEFHQLYGAGMGLPPVSVKRELQDGCYVDRRAMDQQLGLNLGHRTYFSSTDAAAIDRLFRRSRIYQVSHHQVPRCQAEGCKADLSGAKHYHRRHKVCEYHSKTTVVVTGGLQQRFCQQCSRFHVLAEFDEAKRSCRKRLADHNRRRRKPQQQVSTGRSNSTASDPSDEPSINLPCSSSTDNNNNGGQSGDVVLDIPKAAGAVLVAKNSHSKDVFSGFTSTMNGGGTTGTLPKNSSSVMTTTWSMGSSSYLYTNNQKEPLGGRADSKAAHSRNGPQALLSLGGDSGGGFGKVGGGSSSGITPYHDQNHQEQEMRSHRAPFLVRSHQGGSSAAAAGFFNPCSSMSPSFPGHSHNFFYPGSTDGSHGAAASVVSEQSHHHQSHQGSSVHMGHSLFEMDFM